MTKQKQIQGEVGVMEDTGNFGQPKLNDNDNELFGNGNSRYGKSMEQMLGHSSCRYDTIKWQAWIRAPSPWHEPLLICKKIFEIDCEF
jgi:hypothetical protein